MDDVQVNSNGDLFYQGDTFKIVMTRYSDPKRLNLARSAAIYLGKSDRDNTRRPLSIIRNGHVGEIFRGEMAEFEFIDVSKEVYDHIVTYTTRNMRAAGGNRALTSSNYTMPSDKMKDPERVRMNLERSMEAYRDNLEAGETPQVARSAMPASAKMNPFIYQFNFLTLGESLFKQRIWEKGAQGNTVKVVRGMHELCAHVDKELWDTFYEYKGAPVIQWQEVSKRLNANQLTIADVIEHLNGMGVDPKDVLVKNYLMDRFGEQKSIW